MVEKNKKWKREISAGGVVYKQQDDKIFVLLIKPSGKTKNKDSKWSFPKGLIDGSEKSETTAVREVKEEAGIEAKIEEKLGSVKYIFIWEGENIFKIVTFYLMEYVSGDPKDHDFEVAEAKWFELPEVDHHLTYKTDKEIFERAKEILCT